MLRRFSVALTLVLLAFSQTSFIADPASDPSYVSVNTLIASDKGHDILKKPLGVAAMPNGTILIADTEHHNIVAVAANGAASVIAGTGKPGNADGTGTAASFKQPSGVAYDAARQIIYVADTDNHLIRKISATGVVTTLAGSGHAGSDDGTGTAADFRKPAAIAIDRDGNLFVADSDDSTIRRVTPGGVVTTFAGGSHDGYADGAIAQALFKKPEGLAFSADGATLFVADTGNRRIRAIKNGVVSTIAGSGQDGATDGRADVASFKSPSGIAVDDQNGILVADSDNNVIRRVSLAASPVTVSTIAGTKKKGYTDGPIASAQFDSPAGIAIAGSIYVADSGNDAVRIIVPDLKITSISPKRGPLGGGNAVHLFGTGFVSGGTSVSFGANAATNVTFISGGELVATAPAGSGTVDVTVRTAATSSTLSNAYTYVPAPTLTSIAPAKGKIAGGETLTIIGTNFFDGDTSVTIGGVSATATIQSPSSLTIVTPAHAAGPVDVVITTSGGSATRSGGFTYFAAPTIAAFAPQTGGAGTAVTISGQNFDIDPAGDRVTFGALQASVVSASATQLVVSVPNGATNGPITVTTAGGSATTTAPFVVAAYTRLEVTAPVLTIDRGTSLQLNAVGVKTTGAGDDVTSQTSWSSAGIGSVSSSGVFTSSTAGSAQINAAFNGFTANITVTVRDFTTPADPAALAPRLSPAVAPSLADEMRFLYSGPNAIQTGVATGTINEDRVTVLRGKVKTLDGIAIAGAVVTIVNHPEYGQTSSRSDGMYDFVINGGGALTLKFVKNGYIDAQRRVNTAWGEQKHMNDVALVAYDSRVTGVAMNAGAMQVARASQVTDKDGTRQGTILVPAGTTASLVMPDGSRQAVSALHIRATEYTVGPNGPQAMPAALPPTTSYTYCVELSADEAAQSNAASIEFSAPLPYYVDNFIGFPAGTIVPSGFYDRQKSAWMPMPNGVVLKVLAINNGLADVDADGHDAPATTARLAELGITDDERRTLATLYAPGRSLWRIPIPHFSPYDFNWSSFLNGLAPDADAGAVTAEAGATSCNPCSTTGSIIDIQNQSLGETIPVAGTPFTLNYNSNRASKANASQAHIKLSGPTFKTKPDAISLTIDIAGKHFEQTFPANPNLTYDFLWDGTDAYGRQVIGSRDANVQVGYQYSGSGYISAAQGMARSWGMSSAFKILDSSRGLSQVNRDMTIRLTSNRPSDPGLGAWSFSPQHFFDGRGRIIYDGNGVDRGADVLTQSSLAMTTYAGTTGCCIVTDGMLATDAPLDYPQSMSFAGDGSMYIFNSWAVQKIDPTGHIFTISGSQTGRGFSPDGTPAKDARFNGWDVAVSPDGVVYVNDSGSNRIRAIADGKIVTVAGNGQFGGSGLVDGVLATNVAISPEGITFGPDGLLYIADRSRVLRVNADGTVNTLAGDPTKDYRFGDGIPARNAGVSPLGIAVGRDGSVFIADAIAVRKIGTDGIIRTVAGSYNSQLPIVQDGQLGNSGSMGEPWGLDVGPDGTLFIADLERGRESGRVMALSPTGIIRTFAGNGDREVFALAKPGTLAMGTMMNFPWDVKIGPDGGVFALNYDTDSIHKIDSIYPAVRPSQPIRVVASPDGLTADVFDTGRHVRTIDLLTGATIQTFGYNSDGLLVSVTDADNNVTRIERDGDGNVTSIVAPGGQRTNVTISGRDLVAIERPGHETHRFTYDPLFFGLMSTYTDPRSGLHKFTYDVKTGALLKDEDPAGGFTMLARSGTNADSVVTRTSAEGRTSTQEIIRGPNGSETERNVSRDGLLTLRVEGPDGKVTAQNPDGSSMSVTKGADPRFGMMAPVATDSKLTFGSHNLLIKTTRNVTLSDPQNPLSLSTIEESTTINGGLWKRVYTAANRTGVTISPSGRTKTTVLDEKGHLITSGFANLAPTNYAYDSSGLLKTATRGSRQTTFAYDGSRRLSSITDSLGHTVSFEYDAADRLSKETLADGRIVSLQHDTVGNLLSITPPGRSAHVFSYTPVDAVSSYMPPNVTGAGATTYAYNKDRQLTIITRPDTSTLSFGYDGGGRLSSVGTPTGNYIYQYDGSGRVAMVTAPDGGRVSYSYDGKLITSETWTGAVAGSVSHAYDDRLNVISENGAAYQYDVDGMLTAAGAMTIQRDPQNGLVSGTTLANVTDALSYNSFGEPLEYTLSYSGSAVFSQQYTRDNAGRITKLTETVSGTPSNLEYGYDDGGRLTSVKRDGVVAATYVYDANGNRTSKITAAGTETATYDAQDRMVTYGTSAFTYTPNGETATKTDPSGVTQYSYDGFGVLRGVTLTNGTTIDYVVDANDRRIGKKVNGVLVSGWLYGDRLRPVAELDGNGSVVSTFVYGTRTNVPEYMIRGGVTYRIISDHLGSPRFVLDAASNTLAQTITYDEFGNVLSDTNPGFQPFGFAGGLYDRDTGLVRFGARDYDPRTGRWTVKDPIGFAGNQSNVYSYTFGDPINYADPGGTLTIPFIGWVDVGENAGTEALKSYADTLTDPNATWYEKAAAGVGGFFSALWTPCTSDKTFATLASAYAADQYVGRSFWQYTSGDPAYSSRYLTRGWGWEPPYSPGVEAAERLSLPPYNPGITVQEVPNSWRFFAGGPGEVAPNFGHMGGGTEYLAGGWP